MDLSQASTEELRRELHARDERDARNRWEVIANANRCPECGALPRSLNKEAVEEFRFAPRDGEGRAVLFAPYDSENGETGGLRYVVTVTCENGHVTEKEDIVWFKDAKKGPPLLPR